MDYDAYVVETEPRGRDIRYLQHRLYEYNAEQTGFRDGKWLAIFLRDASGSMVAGLYGWTWAGCLKVRTFGFAKTNAVGGVVANCSRQLRMRLVRAAACEPFSIPTAFSHLVSIRSAAIPS
jgi:hypothetical protein